MAKFPSQYDEQERRNAPRVPLDVRVDVVSDGRERECRTFDASASGAYVCTQEPARVNQVVRVVVNPDSDRPLEWMGRVRRVVAPDAPGPEPPGMAVEIFGIGDAERIRWSDLLAHAAQSYEDRDGSTQRQQRQSPPSNQPRRHVRLATHLEVSIRDLRGLFRYVARDISAGGVFVRSRERVDVGETIDLTIRHPVSQQTFVLAGRVSRVEASGLAVEFVELPPDRRRDLQRFIMTGRGPA